MLTANESGALTNEKLADTFQTLARTTDVPFLLYEKSTRGKLEVKFSPLTGRNWRRFVHLIGPKIRESVGVLPEATKHKFADLFETFDSILTFVGNCTPDDADEVARRTHEWVKLFLELGGRMAPYVHDFHVHLPMSVKLFGGQSQLSGEFVEKKQSCLKRTHMRKTNRKNPQQTLLTQLRIERHERGQQMKIFEQQKGQKRKARTQHPSVAEANRRREKENREREDEERRQFSEAQSPYAQLSIPQLKELIFTKTGRRTQKRTRDSLLDILWNADHYGNQPFSGEYNATLFKETP